MRQFHERSGHRFMASSVGSSMSLVILINSDPDHVMRVVDKSVECDCHIATSTDELDGMHLEALQACNAAIVPAIREETRKLLKLRREARIAAALRI